jgi:hypothetical protein
VIHLVDEGEDLADDVAQVARCVRQHRSHSVATADRHAVAGKQPVRVERSHLFQRICPAHRVALYFLRVVVRKNVVMFFVAQPCGGSENVSV